MEDEKHYFIDDTKFLRSLICDSVQLLNMVTRCSGTDHHALMFRCRCSVIGVEHRQLGASRARSRRGRPSAPHTGRSPRARPIRSGPSTARSSKGGPLPLATSRARPSRIAATSFGPRGPHPARSGSTADPQWRVRWARTAIATCDRITRSRRAIVATPLDPLNGCSVRLAQSARSVRAIRPRDQSVRSASLDPFRLDPSTLDPSRRRDSP
jgi:hypothetical protein